MVRLFPVRVTDGVTVPVTVIDGVTDRAGARWPPF